MDEQTTGPLPPWEAAKRAWEAWVEAKKEDPDHSNMRTIALGAKYRQLREEARRLHPKGAP